ncbi:MAG: hypothetical protein PHW63_07460 [Alphaproteobacteria bacterium]|nr:hypothetical protein [Alphaproteobacteria bacterium]
MELFDRMAAYFLAAFTKPFRGLATVVGGLFFLSFLTLEEGPFRYGRFMDSDDIVHLSRVWDFLNGQSWFDPVVHRIMPPDGMATHFSRLAEIPLLFLMGFLHQGGADFVSASYLTMTVVPLALFASFFVVAAWSTEPLVGQEWFRLSAVTLFFAYPVTSELAPPRADHHALSLLCMLMMLGFVFRLWFRPKSLPRYAVGAGIMGALSLVIALETLPWVIALSGLVGLLLVVRGRPMAQSGAVFGLSLFLSAALFLVATAAPESYFKPDSLMYSSLYVVLAGCLGGLFILTAGAARLWEAWRVWAAAGAAAILMGCGFLTLFPFMIDGPFGGMDKSMAEMMGKYLILNVPLSGKYESIFNLLQALGLPIVATVSAFVFLDEEDDAEKSWFWCGYGLVLLVALISAVYYQQRISLFAHLFSVPVFVEVIARLWAFGKARLPKLWRLLPIFVLLFSMDTGLSLLIDTVGVPEKPEAQLDARPYFFTFKTPHDPQPSVWQVLSDPAGLGDRPRRIMNMMNEAGPLLLFTQHTFMAAPYHTNIKANKESLQFFLTKYPEVARRIVRENEIDLVLASPRRAPSYSEESVEDNILLTMVSEGRPRKEGPDFEQQLTDGQVPDWLVRVPASEHNDQYLFEVVKDRL